MKEQNQFLTHRIEALEKENQRLNDELRKVKKMALKLTLSDPNFDKPLSEIETNFEIVEPLKN